MNDYKKDDLWSRAYKEAAPGGTGWPRCWFIIDWWNEEFWLFTPIWGGDKELVYDAR